MNGQGLPARLAILLVLFAGAADAQTATDGDTIKFNGSTWRLWGIHAPQPSQPCLDGWLAGIESARALQSRMLGKRIECEFRGKDRYGRSIGLCQADGRDLAADMVEAGMAWAFTRYSSDYVEQERAAVSARLGVHAHDCEKAWDWRAQQRR